MCSVDGCERGHHARGYCEMHYRRLTRRGALGDALARREQRRFALPTEQRFHERTVRAPNGCLLWLGARTSWGYGEIQADGRTVYVHRWAYEQFVGPIPEGLDIDHRCHNSDPACPGGTSCYHRCCVEPSHLEPVTKADNNRRARARERMR